MSAVKFFERLDFERKSSFFKAPLIRTDCMVGVFFILMLFGNKELGS